MPYAIAAAALGAGVSIFEGSQAAGAQKKAAGQALAAQEKGYQRASGALEPYNQAGQTSTNSLMNILGIGPGGSGKMNTDFLRSMPGYNAELQAGSDAIANEHSALGGVNSGATLKELDQFGINTADQNIFKYITQMMNMSHLGESAAGGIASSATGVANNTGNIALQQGNTGAANAAGMGTSIGNFLNNPAVLDALKGINFGGGGSGEGKGGF